MRTSHSSYTAPEAGITPDKYRQIHRDTIEYMETFRNAQNAFDAPLQLKVDHTFRVAAECRWLASALQWPENAQCAAELLGLLHDIGRFSQYADFGSFSDPATVNHGERGAEVLEQTGLTASIPKALQKILIDSVRLHNVRMLPKDLPVEMLPWIWLIRDADKIDIYRVVLDAYHHDGFSELPAMLPHISLAPHCDLKHVTEFENEICSSTKTARTLGDFFVLLLSWIYVFNYRPTLERLQQQDVFNQVLACLEPAEAQQRVRNKLNTYLAVTS